MLFRAPVSTKPVVIIPLGLLFVPNDSLAFIEFAKLIGNENLPQLLKEAKPFIDQFKLGEIDEAIFDQQIVAILQKISKKEITKEQFNYCWAARYDKKNIKDLTSITAESKDCLFLIYSYTNPKDEGIITQICKEHKITHEVEKGNLKSINGVDIQETFRERIDKITLLKKIAKNQTNKEITLIIGSEDHQTIPLLKSESEKINLELIKTADSMNIHVITVDPKAALDMNAILSKGEKLSFKCNL